MRVRIEDVARKAGVSMKTVSRVLNDEPNVRDGTRQRVQEAAKSLDYHPHLSARSLAGQRSYFIALLYDNPSANYIMEVLAGVMEACDRHAYNMILTSLFYSDPAFLDNAMSRVVHSRADGVVLTPPLTEDDALMDRLRQQGIPFASVSPKQRDGRLGVTMDERRATCELVSHLVDQGHTRIAHIKGHPLHGASEWRLDGYRDALQRAGIAFDPALVIDGAFTFDSGVAGARALLDMATPPTAIFAGNDDCAAGVLNVAYERGIPVPQALSVCGFDDTPTSHQISPSLTTVHQPSREMGRIAATELIASIRSRDRHASIVDMPFEIRLRESTGPVPAARR